ncbi:MAG: sulfite reductase [Rhodomicrobium sp.]|nr:MAG: sulfite reductase [Rhodomicrobium sp.]
MYIYDDFDETFVRERAAQFRDQVERRLSGALTEEQFRPLRLMNGVYLQLHAYMLRVAIPYGTLSSGQMRQLAMIARKYDKGYGHFTTRQNIQYNWPKLKDLPDILDDLADVGMHAIQTSGNCIRNVTSDQWAGVAADEVTDPRPYAELMRQWSSLHPEFSYLPRKFKIAITGAEQDRAAIAFHDIGIRVKRNETGEIGFDVYVGGGLGRTPMVAKKIGEFISVNDLLPYLIAILRAYNLEGRRDNKYKARIKILVHEKGAEAFKARVEEIFAGLDKDKLRAPQGELERIAKFFDNPAYETLEIEPASLREARADNKAFDAWVRRNVAAHKTDGYAIANISLKPVEGIPGDASAEQMELVAQMADDYSFGEIRVSHEQNLVLAHVKKSDLYTIWQALEANGLGTPNIGAITDMITCPGLDYCALATARSIPIAQKISHKFSSSERQSEIGDLKIKISGCINACGHHHAGHIGILGLDKKGEEYYQITLGGSGDENAAVGEILGPGFSADDVADAIDTLVERYIQLRSSEGETFLDVVKRVGLEPFKEALYADH